MLAAALLLVACRTGAIHAGAVSQRPDPVWFCAPAVTTHPHDCDWQSVELPHRWIAPTFPERSLRYRFEVVFDQPGLFAVVASGLPDAATVHLADNRSLAATDAPRLRLRYWPQLLPIDIDRPGAVLLEISASAVPGSVNGLGSLTVAAFGQAQVIQREQWQRQVLLPLALAAIAAIAGVVSLIIGASGGMAGTLLRLVGITGLAVAARIAMNHMIEVPFPAQTWSVLGLALLLFIDLMICLIALAYIRPAGLHPGPRALGLAAVVSAGLLMVPSRWALAVAIGAFFVVGALALLLLSWLALVFLRRRDASGAGLLAAFSIATAAGLHDLALHLGWIAPAHGPIQMLATPVLVVLMALLLIGVASSRQQLESALDDETRRRQRLMQDLHDGLGSRLVALAFRARKAGADPLLARGIDELMGELRMINHAVRVAPSTLGAVLADARRAYGEPGAGGLPLDWQIDERAASVRLGAEQAIATLRILEEAVANAVRHAQPTTITICAAPGPEGEAAELRIEDNGAGEFRLPSTGGLANMRQRALAAGLSLRFERTESGKRVCLSFPAGSGERRSWLRRWCGLRPGSPA